MTDDPKTSVSTNRRRFLKGTATAGLLGAGITGTASASGWREVRFRSTGKATFHYYLKVDGAVKRGGTYQSDSWDKVGNNYVKGTVAEGRCDSFLVRGTVIGRKFSGPGKMKLGGKVSKSHGGGGGHDGKDGHDGHDGKDGHDGHDGKDGHDGHDGHDGKDKKDDKDWKDGDDKDDKDDKDWKDGDDKDDKDDEDGGHKKVSGVVGRLLRSGP